MSWPVHIERLKDSELTFELESRGFEFTNVREARNKIRSILKLEKDKIVNPVKSENPYADDANYIGVKITEISENVDNFNGDKNSKFFKEISAKTQLVDRLLKRCNATTNEQKKAKDNFFIRITEIQNIANKLIKRFNNKSITVTPVRPSLHSTAIETSESSDESESDNDHNTTRRAVNYNNSFKPCPVIKWNVTFSGEKNQSVKAFLSRVNELKIARGVDDNQLFNSAVDLFSGKGLIWFRSIRNDANSWSDIVRLLTENFQPVDYDEKLYDEIRTRKQGKTEDITMFFAIMSNLFSRLSWKIPDANQTKIIINNLDPQYSNQLGFDEIESVKELLRRCKILEARKLAKIDFISPVNAQRPILEADLAYVEPIEKPSYYTDMRNRRNFRNPNPINTMHTNVSCWNCRQKGHLAPNCPEPQNKHCYGCGEPNVTRSQCRKCSGNVRTTLAVESRARGIVQPRHIPQRN